MALAANGTAVLRDSVQLAAQAATTAAIFNQARVFGGHNSHGTSATRGRVAPWTGADGEIPLGRATSRQTGDTSATPIVEATVDMSAYIAKNIAVTGLAGTIADNFKKVYQITDDNTFTLTRPAAGSSTLPVGVVTRFISSTNCDVYFFSFETMCAIALAGGGSSNVLVGVVNGVESAGNHATGIVLTGHGKILSCYGVVFEPMADADSTATVNLEIGGTNVTGGVITWATADVLGDKKDGTAITAANEFHDGDLLDVEVAAGTAGTAADGYMAVYAVIEWELGL